MSTITRDDRLGIYNAISSTDFFENLCSQGMLISFLNSIWELRALPSTDSRFVDLMGDILDANIHPALISRYKA